MCCDVCSGTVWYARLNPLMAPLLLEVPRDLDAGVVEATFQQTVGYLSFARGLGCRTGC